ncbi:protein kinase [Pelomyxa schiedti]|nr:protein kinase [Pelomyxa schiedti]
MACSQGGHTTSTSASSCVVTQRGTHGIVVGYDEFQRVMRERDEFFRRLALSVSVSDVQRSMGSLIVASNFRLVRPIGFGSNGMVYEVKCVGAWHPDFFRDVSYVLKVPFTYGVSTTNLQNAFENEYLISATLPQHPNVNRYFCHFTDRIPQEYYDLLPYHIKELIWDPVRNRTHACGWVVFEHHSDTLEHFLRDRNATHPLGAATPWPIVHKYSRDICAGLVHLFRNATIHFDMKLNNIVISSNKEQAILIDLGCAMKFHSESFESDLASIIAAQGNQSHRAPELINGLAQHRQNPSPRSILSCKKQPSFELGCILFEIAMGGQHPLPGYPLGYGASGNITFSFENEDLFPMKPAEFPKEFCNLVRSLLQCDPEKRMPLLEASKVLESLISPTPSELLSFYTCVTPATDDPGALTTKATCQLLCGAEKDCVTTLNRALEIEPSFSPALLVLHYLNSWSATTTSSGCQQQPGVCTSLTCNSASFTTTDVDFVRAVINQRHRTTLPELILQALWTRHISHEPDSYWHTTQLLSAAIQQQQPQVQSTASHFLRASPGDENDTNEQTPAQVPSRTEHASSAQPQESPHTTTTSNTLAIQSLSPRSSDSHVLATPETSREAQQPGDQAASTSLESSPLLPCKRPRSPTPDHLMHTKDQGTPYSINQTQRVSQPLLPHPQNPKKGSSYRSNVGLSPQSHLAPPQHFLPPSPSYSGGVDQPTHHSALLPAPLNEAALTSPNNETLEHPAFNPSKAISLYERAADAGDTRAMHSLAVHYYTGEGVNKDLSKAVSLFQGAADGGDMHATFKLGMCYYRGEGVGKDMSKAITLITRAAEGGVAEAMTILGKSYTLGTGVGKDISKAVAWHQRAADAGNPRGLYMLGMIYMDGDGVTRDICAAASLFQRAADGGVPQAMVNLGMLYMQGEGVPKDPGKAVALFQRASVTDDVDGTRIKAIYNLGVCYLKGLGVEQDTDKAVSFLQVAADAGDPNAMVALAIVLENVSKGIS